MDKNESKINLPSAEVYGGSLCDDREDSYEPRKAAMTFKTKDSKVTLLRQKICEFLHSHTFQIAIIALVLLDCAIVIAEIMMDSSKDGGHGLHIAETVLHFTSLTILCLFTFEIMVKLFAMGLSFFHYKWEVFDAIIVLVSLFLDIFLSRDEPVKDGVEFIILLRLWRITRVINGIILSVKTQAEEKLNHLRDERDYLQEQLHQLELKVDAQKKEIRYLRERLVSVGIDVDSPSERDQ